jgi:hypothetical protein
MFYQAEITSSNEYASLMSTNCEYDSDAKLAAIISVYNLHILIYHGNNYLHPINIYGTG